MGHNRVTEAHLTLHVNMKWSISEMHEAGLLCVSESSVVHQCFLQHQIFCINIEKHTYENLLLLSFVNFMLNLLEETLARCFFFQPHHAQESS